MWSNVLPDAALLQYSQLTGLHRAEDTSISDLRQYIVDMAKGDTPIRRLLTAGDADEADFVSLDRDRIPRNRMYRLVERLTWRLFTTVSRIPDEHGMIDTRHG
jgi:hypothetical protein